MNVKLLNNSNIDLTNILSDEGKKKRKGFGNWLLTPPDSYVVVDLEMNSVPWKRSEDETIEIGAIKVINNQIIEDFHCLVKPSKKLYIRIKRKTKLTDKMLEDKPMIQDVILDLKDFIGDLPILGFELFNDIKMITRDLKKHFDIKFKNNYFDIRIFVEILLWYLPKRSLSSVAEYLKIDNSYAHEALEDCYMCFEVYQIIKPTIEKITDTNIFDESSLSNPKDFFNKITKTIIEEYCDINAIKNFVKGKKILLYKINNSNLQGFLAKVIRVCGGKVYKKIDESIDYFVTHQSLLDFELEDHWPEGYKLARELNKHRRCFRFIGLDDFVEKMQIKNLKRF